MRGLSLPKIRSLLCLGAHADDIEIGCGGTVLRFLQQSEPPEVHWVVFSGSEERHREARASAKMYLGGAPVELLSFRDSFFPAEWSQIKETMAGLGRRLNPDLILTHRLEDRHQDHRVIAELTWCAFRDHLIWEYEVPKYEADLGSPNVYVPIPEDLARAKSPGPAVALSSARPANPGLTKTCSGRCMRLRGAECHAASRFAEGFYSRKAVLE